MNSWQKGFHICPQFTIIDSILTTLYKFFISVSIHRLKMIISSLDFYIFPQTTWDRWWDQGAIHCIYAATGLECRICKSILKTCRVSQVFTNTRGFQTLESKYFDKFDMRAVIKHCLKTFQSSIKIMAKCFRKIPGCLM